MILTKGGPSIASEAKETFGRLSNNLTYLWGQTSLSGVLLFHVMTHPKSHHMHTKIRDINNSLLLLHLHSWNIYLMSIQPSDTSPTLMLTCFFCPHVIQIFLYILFGRIWPNHSRECCEMENGEEVMVFVGWIDDSLRSGAAPLLQERQRWNM